MNIIFEIIRIRKNTFITIFALALANIILRLFIAGAQEPRLESLQKEWLDKRARQFVGTADKAYIYEQGKKDLADFYSRIPSKKEFARVVGNILEIASTNGLTIGSIGYKPSVIKNRDMLVYALGFGVTGRYAAIKSFISDIESSPDILSIDSISLTREDLSHDSVKFSIMVSAFFRTEKQ